MYLCFCTIKILHYLLRMSKPISRIQRPIATATMTMIITDATEIKFEIEI